MHQRHFAQTFFIVMSPAFWLVVEYGEPAIFNRMIYV